MVIDRRVPTEPPTYRESMEATYELMRQAAQAEATALEGLDQAWKAARDVGLEPMPKEHKDYSGRYFANNAKGEHQVRAALAVGKADAGFQRARAERKHWERYWRRYADMLDAHPEISDQPLRRAGWVRKVAGKAA